MVAEVLAPNREAVLSKAVLTAADQLGLNQSELGRTIGVDRSRISRLKRQLNLDPASKQGELALMLIRVARALFALNGGDHDITRHFMSTPNRITQGTPKEQVQTIQGLCSVLSFVDAIRGKN